MNTKGRTLLAAATMLVLPFSLNLNAATLIQHWLLNEQFPQLDPAFQPEGERAVSAALANQVPGGSQALFIKGGSVDDPAPVYGAAAPGAAFQGSTGSIGNGFQESYIALGQVAPQSDPFTYAFWFKRMPGQPFGTPEEHLLQSNAGGSQVNRWGFRVRNGNNDTGTFLLDLWQNGATTVTIASGMESDRWYHLAMTRDSLDNFTLYLDGGEVHSGVRSIPFTSAPDGVFLGNDPHRAANDYDRYFPGLFDDFRIYDDALSASQIEALAIPEPSTYALVFGIVVLGGAFLVRRSRRALSRE